MEPDVVTTQLTAEENAVIDAAIAELYSPDEIESAKILTLGHGVLRGPDGEIKQEIFHKNLITSNGDLVYAQRASGAAAPAAPTGMRLGTGGGTAVAKSGAGSFIATYVAASAKAFEATFPSVAVNGSAQRASYKCIWGAGVATSNGINELVLTNESPLTNVQGAAGNTISRIILSPVVDKGNNDTFEYTLSHDFQGQQPTEEDQMALVDYTMTRPAPEGNAHFTITYDNITEVVDSARCNNTNPVRWTRIDFYNPGTSTPIYTHWTNPGQDTGNVKIRGRITMSEYDRTMRFSMTGPA